MNNVKLRRFTAYCLDLLIITLIATGLFEIKALHPYADKYEDAYNEYNDYVTKVREATTGEKAKEGTLIAYFNSDLSEEDFKKIETDLNKIDNVTDTKLVTKEDISSEEKDKLILSIKDYFNTNENVSAYIVSIKDIDKADDIIKDIQKVENIDETLEYKDSEEIKSIVDMTDSERKEYLAKTGSLLRDVDYYGISYNICWLAVIILYFTLFPYFNKGMTIGKRVVKLQMVRSDDEKKKVSLWQYLVKAILCPIYGTAALSNSLTFIVMVITPLLLDGANFAYVTTYINLAISLICYIDFFVIAFRKDGLGISDKLAKVKVIDYVGNQENN